MTARKNQRQNKKNSAACRDAKEVETVINLKSVVWWGETDVGPGSATLSALLFHGCGILCELLVQRLEALVSAREIPVQLSNLHVDLATSCFSVSACVAEEQERT